MAPPDWQPWHTAAFLDAQRRRRPVLLLLDAGWAPASLVAHAEVFARPDVSAAIAEATVPVRVDIDRRPDIADRYGLGHWPTLLLLTPDGHVLTGGTHLDASLAVRIRQAAAAFAAGPPHPRPAASPFGPDTRSPTPEPGSTAALAAAWLAPVERALAATNRLPATVAAAATLCAFAHAAIADDPGWARLAAAAVDALEVSPTTHDRGDDAAPAPPRRLEDEAEWVRVLARAVMLEPVPEWQASLDRRLDALMAFRRPDGLWRPWIGTSPLVLVDASARACRALLAAAAARDDADLAGLAVDGLEALAPVAYARAAGVAHVIEQGRPHAPLLLDDAMLLAHAALDADRWRGEPVYRDLAEELLQTTLTRLAHPSGALVDRVASLAGAGQVGRLAEAYLPLVGNAEAARLLVRLHPGDDESLGRARRLLAGVDAEARDAGVFGALVGLAWIGLEPAGGATTAW